MRFEPLPSYIRSFKKLEPALKERVKDAIDKYVDFFEGGPRPEGLGIKRLSNHIWEIRVDLKIRVVFRLEKDLVQWGLVGSHDDIKRFIRYFR